MCSRWGAAWAHPARHPGPPRPLRRRPAAARPLAPARWQLAGRPCTLRGEGPGRGSSGGGAGGGPECVLTWSLPAQTRVTWRCVRAPGGPPAQPHSPVLPEPQLRLHPFLAQARVWWARLGTREPLKSESPVTCLEPKVQVLQLCAKRKLTGCFSPLELTGCLESVNRSC